MKEYKKNWLSVKFLKFILVGGGSTGIDFVIYLFLSKRWPITRSKIVSMGVSSVFSFMANKNYTFRKAGKTDLKCLLRFYGTFAVNFGINVGVNHMVYFLTGYKMLAFAIATCCGMIANYLLQKNFVFPNKGDL